LPTRVDRPFYRAMQESQFLTFLTRATRALCYKGTGGKVFKSSQLRGDLDDNHANRH
jgi:hypothetical protein